jgi:hypothetical protein
MDSNILKKKVAGVPVVYPAAAFVLVLVFFAWKMKSADATPDGDLPIGTDEEGTAVGEADYSGLKSNGTVTVQQGQDPATVTPVVVKTNDTWIADGVNYLVTNGYSGGAAQSALSKYINSQQLSYEEGQMRDLVIKQYGLPPEPFAPGSTGQKPASRQGTPPLYHTIQSGNDNTYTKLAQLYYAKTDSASVALISGHNANAGALTTGTRVFIPKYATPKYITATKSTDQIGEVAAKNGKSKTEIHALNPTLVFPVKIGTKIRVA